MRWIRGRKNKKPQIPREQSAKSDGFFFGLGAWRLELGTYFFSGRDGDGL